MKKVILSLVTAAMLCGTAAIAKTSAEVSKDALQSAKSDAKTKQVHVVKEAVSAVMLTQKVLADIDKSDMTSAIKDLEDAIGKLEVILANEKAPRLLPIDGSITAFEFIGGDKEIEKNIKIVRNLLDDGKVQEARKLLNTLQSQINVTSVSLPLVSYPDALKLAAKYLHDKKTEQARVVLETALNTMVENIVIIPIPLLKAEALITAASKITKTDKEQALKHLAQAKAELKKAKLLGYVSKSDVTYKSLNDSIEEIEKEVKGKNSAEKMFENLMKKIKSFKEKIVGGSGSDKK